MMTVGQRRTDAIFLAGWVLSGLFGYSVGFPVGLAVGASLVWGWLIGAAITATLQWALIRPRVAQHGWWIVVSMVGITIGTLVGSVLSQFAIQSAGLTAAFIMVGGAAGLGLGLGQYIVLRVNFSLAGWWVLASTVGYSLGLFLAINTPISFPAISSVVFGPEFGGSIGAISGIVTGLPLLWLMRHPISTQVQPASAEQILAETRREG